MPAEPTLAALRERIAAIGKDGRAGALGSDDRRALVALGHSGVDAALGGGLRRGALHEVMPAGPRDAAAATGFALALAARFGAARAPWFWVRQDMAALEAGEPYGPGLAGFGLDPARLTIVAAADAQDALRAAEEALRCPALAAVVLEPWGDPRVLDLTASRRLVLAAEGSGVPAVLLRGGSAAAPSAAATRWRIAPAASAAPAGMGPGHPVIAATLERSRTGRSGSWTLEWNAHERIFRLPAAHPLAGGAASAGRPAAAPGADATPVRRAG
jgi:protein ImuA